MANVGNSLLTGLGGASTGATLGSVIPGVGTAVGAGAGGVLGLLGGLLSSNQSQGNFLSGYPSNVEQVATRNPQQISLMNQLGQLGLQGLLKTTDFAPIAQQARTNFSQNTIPSIAERFSSLGAQRSSGFGQQLGSAAAGLEGNLAALQSQNNLSQQGLYQNLLGLGLAPQFQNKFNEAEPGLAQTVPGEILKNLPVLLQVLGNLGYLGNQNKP